MSNILTVAYSVEGPTDARFLEGVIQRTFEDIAFSCGMDIDVYPVSNIPSPGLGSMVGNVVQLAKDAFSRGIQVLCIHTDADHETNAEAFAHKINPAFKAVAEAAEDVCKNLVAVIPVRMSEAWMLADKDLLKEELGTNKTYAALGIARHPETIADPKSVIEEAIRIIEADLPRKSRQINISDLYQPLGQIIPLGALAHLNSYMQFKQSAIESFRKLNYLF